MDNKTYTGSSAAAEETLRRSQQLSEQLADITAKVLRFTNAGGAAIAIGSKDVAVTKAASGDLAPDLETPIRLEGSFAGLCIREGELLYCEDAENDPRVDAATSAAMRLRSMVMVPIGERANICGVLAAFSGVPGAFRPTHIAVLRTLADIVHELIVREDQNKAPEPATQSARRYEAPVAPPAPAPPAVSAFSVEPPAPVRPETAAPVMSAAPAPTFQPEPPPIIPPVVERVHESAKIIEIPRPLQTSYSAPVEVPKPEPIVEAAKAIEPSKAVEPAKPVEAQAPVETPKFESPKKEKEPLPSIIALTNQAKRAEPIPEVADSNVLPAAADPMNKPSAAAGTAAALKPARAPKQRPVEPAVSSHKSSPANTSDSQMFRGLEHSAPDSNPVIKYAGIAVVGLLVLGGAVWGMRSFVRKPAPQPAPVAQVAAPTQEPVASPSASDLTLSTVAAGGSQKAAATTTSPTVSTQPKPETKTEAKAPETKKEALIIANKVGSMPHRAAQGDVDAPQVALGNSGGNLGALLSSKSATPTLNVKRSSLSPPEVIRRVPPKFPEFARRSNPAGDRVVLNVTVNKEGKVGNVQVVRGQSIFSEAAVNAVKQWQYRPAFLNGEAVEATVEVVISFTNGR